MIDLVKKMGQIFICAWDVLMALVWAQFHNLPFWNLLEIIKLKFNWILRGTNELRKICQQTVPKIFQEWYAMENEHLSFTNMTEQVQGGW